MARRTAEGQLSLFGGGGGVEGLGGEGDAGGGEVAPPRAPGVGAEEPTPEVAELGRLLPPGIHLGGSTWSFPGWEGLVYDRKYGETRLAREGLAAYARHPLLRGVGIDRTHYQPLPAEDFRRYADVVPDGFRFLVKSVLLGLDGVRVIIICPG